MAGWAIWERASERQQADDERASLSVGEALATSVGRSLAIMRASSGLVEPGGSVDTRTLLGGARGITGGGTANALGLVVFDMQLGKVYRSATAQKKKPSKGPKKATTKKTKTVAAKKPTKKKAAAPKKKKGT